MGAMHCLDVDELNKEEIWLPLIASHQLEVLESSYTFQRQVLMIGAKNWGEY